MPNYMAISNYGETLHNLGPHPRKGLLDRLGRKHAAKMYQDTTSGETFHIGYIVAGRWWTVYKVERMRGKA